MPLYRAGSPQEAVGAWRGSTGGCSFDRFVVQVSSGQLLVTIKRVNKAASYKIRYAPAAADGTPTTWMTMPATRVRPATSINNLTPGTVYTFQVQALGNLGFSDWSDAVNRMTI